VIFFYVVTSCLLEHAGLFVVNLVCVISCIAMSEGTPVGGRAGGFMRQRHRQGYASSGI
jgi:hypothetical protein